jgi:hypothetical protein
MKSWGHILKGEALSMETTPVAVRLVVLDVDIFPKISLVVVCADSGGERDGQHSGLSSLHPTRGTSMAPPWYSASAVYCGTLQVPTRMAWPVYGVVGNRGLALEDVVVGLEVVGSVGTTLDTADNEFDEGSMTIANVLIEVTVRVAAPVLARLATDEVDWAKQEQKRRKSQRHESNCIVAVEAHIRKTEEVVFPLREGATSADDWELL